MTFFFDLGEIVLLCFLTLDTLGYLAEFRKRSNSNLRDYVRICYTWIFFLIFRSVSCSKCSGVIGHFYGMFMLLAKIYVTLPIFKGTEKIYDVLIEKNAIINYVKEIKENLVAEVEIKEEHSKNE